MPEQTLPPLYAKTRAPLSPAEAGRIGARRRWGAPRVARLDQLDPRVREAVLALIRADEAARAEQERINPEAA